MVELTRSFLGGLATVPAAASQGRYGDILPGALTAPDTARPTPPDTAPDTGAPGTAEGRRMTGFRKFLLHGNLIDLAVAVVVGVAFSQVVQALIKDLITPLIAALGGKPNFSGLVFSINKSHFHYGDFINVALYFLIIAAVVYYFVVAPANRMSTVATRNAGLIERPCPECLSDIPTAARRCRFCTAVVEPHSNGQPERLSPVGAFRERATWRPRRWPPPRSSRET